MFFVLLFNSRSDCFVVVVVVFSTAGLNWLWTRLQVTDSETQNKEPCTEVRTRAVCVLW